MAAVTAAVATVAAGAAVAGAVVESLPIMAVAAGVGSVAATIKVIEHRREEHVASVRSTTPVARVA